MRVIVSEIELDFLDESDIIEDAKSTKQEEIDPSLDEADILGDDYDTIEADNALISTPSKVVPRAHPDLVSMHDEDIDGALLKPINNISFLINDNLRIRGHRHGWSIDSRGELDRNGEKRIVWVARWHYRNLDDAVTNLVKMSHTFIPSKDLVNYQESQRGFLKDVVNLLATINSDFREPVLLRRILQLQLRLAYYKKVINDNSIIMRRRHRK